MGYSAKGYALIGDDELQEIHEITYRPRRLTDFWVRLVMALLLAASLAYNGFHARTLMHEKTRPDQCRSNYSGLSYDTPVVYHSNLEAELNATEKDAYWKSLDTSPFAIVLGEEEAKGYGLGPSVPFPWDTEKNIYYIKAFHHVHCLKVIRSAFKVYESGKMYNPAKQEHLYHCLDALRQDIMCKPDDSIMSSRAKAHVIGGGQTFQYRSWEKLTEWAQDPVKNACFKVFDDDRHVSHQLEVYSFCPKDSPYHETVQAYYAKHGHKPIYEEGDKVDSYNTMSES